MQQEWINALIGGGLIGLSATILLIFKGRVTGISGIMFGVIKPIKNDTMWKFKFILGLIIGGLLAGGMIEDAFVNTSERSMLAVAIAGLLVGFGTRLSSGCTSGHGVCGLSRGSRRSLAATLSFILAGMVSVAVISKFVGGI